MDFSSKTIVVSGATSGIGLACAEMLVQAGASVLGIGRSAQRCAAAEQRLQQLAQAQPVKYFTADLGLQSDVRRVADEIAAWLAQHGGKLDGLVNNAGTFTFWLTFTPEGIETQWAVNHLAPFLLTHQLLPLLQAAPMARVVTVSSNSHYGARIRWSDPQLRRGYNGLRAYGVTKLANVLFSQSFNQHYARSCNVRAFAADPGLVRTDIGIKGTPALVNWFWKLRSAGGTSPQVPARNIVYLLGEASIQNSPDVYWKDCQPKRPSTAARDTASAQRLWELSETLCGLQAEEQPCSTR